jgi:hypothetical protein
VRVLAYEKEKSKETSMMSLKSFIRYLKIKLLSISSVSIKTKGEKSKLSVTTKGIFLRIKRSGGYTKPLKAFSIGL